MNWKFWQRRPEPKFSIGDKVAVSNMVNMVVIPATVITDRKYVKDGDTVIPTTTKTPGIVSGSSWHYEVLSRPGRTTAEKWLRPIDDDEYQEDETSEIEPEPVLSPDIEEEA